MVKTIKVTFLDPNTKTIIVRHRGIRIDQGDRKRDRELELVEQEAPRLG